VNPNPLANQFGHADLSYIGTSVGDIIIVLSVAKERFAFRLVRTG